jgi:hypothetical protein
MRETETEKTMTERTDEREVEWPPPRDDPPEEPSHPGARLDELEERLATEEERHGPDS